MNKIFVLLFVLSVSASCTQTEKQKPSDPLPSWNEGAAKEAIIEFVNSSTNSSSNTFIPKSERIVVFDNDGTLWSEQPLYFQFAFALDRIKQLAPEHPEWNDDPLFQAAINRDLETIMQSGVNGLLTLTMASHAGITTTEFKQKVKNWINSARHPKTGKLYKEMVFQPMLEVLDYFRANDFKTFIVSGGGIDFMRPWTEEVYGIPGEQVIGSSGKVKYDVIDGNPAIVKLPEINFIDDKEGKPVGIYYHIGKRPVAAFGNSDGDLAMLQYTAAGDGNRLMVYIHHTDADREWAYDRDSHIGRFNKGLDEAAEKGWTVVDMKEDWKVIYP